MIELVDPFIGTGVADLPAPEGMAAAWWSPKPQIGNTHPGACSPFGMVSAGAYSGAYPTGYGLYGMSTEGVPPRLFDRYRASGFTHFQQSGTGAIRKYYNYVRVTPMLQPLDDLDEQWALHDEVASPGYYAATLDPGIRCELTVGPTTAVHRYTFPAHRSSRVVVDLSLGGLAIEHGRTVPIRAQLESLGPGHAQGTVVMEGVPLSVFLEIDAPGFRQMLWYDRRLMAGGTRLDFDSIRPTTLRPFGLLFMGPTEAGDVVELRMGFSLRGCDQARRNLERECGVGRPAFDRRRTATEETWREHLGRVQVEGGSADRRTTFATALYHSMVKPCFAADESPFWSADGPFVFDICTMWDIYKTQLPLLATVAPERTVELLNALLRVAEEEGNLPIGYRMARGADRFFRQASALVHTAVADAAHLDLPGIDWDWALVHLHADLRRTYGEDFLVRGVAHPITHTLDLAFGHHCTARIARKVGDDRLADTLDRHAADWINAFDPATGLLIESTFYEGGRWNYSFRLVHDMAGRIALAGGDDAFVGLLDRFFGRGAPPVKQLGEAPSAEEVAAGYALDRFQGLNNEPDMEAPYAYHYAGRPDRSAEVVQSALDFRFGTGRGGLSGNDDSGGLSSWYVWASLGLFPVAGQGVFLLDAPAFARARLRTGSGELEIETDGHADRQPGDPHRYVQSVELDGVRLERAHLTVDELHRARRLVVRLGDRPSDWGSRVRPPSSSDSRPVDPTRPAHSTRPADSSRPADPTRPAERRPGG